MPALQALWQRQVTLPGLGLSQPENGAIDYVQMSCSGATARQMLGQDPKDDEPWRTNPVQVNTLQGNESHVLMQAGRNDLGFVNIVRDCTLLPDCGKAKSVLNLPTMIDDFTRPEGSLDRAVRAVHGKASRARIVLMGYPKLFGEPSEGDRGCLGVSRNEATAVDGQVPHLNDRVRQRVGEWKRDGINIAFVDPAQAFSGHEACTAGSKWVGSLGGAVKGNGKAGAFHPTHRGHQELARLASEAI